MFKSGFAVHTVGGGARHGRAATRPGLVNRDHLNRGRSNRGHSNRGIDAPRRRRTAVDTVAHHGRETAYRTEPGAGDSAAGLLYVHGSGGTSAVWDAQLSDLVDGRTSSALDLSGHGDSEDVDAGAGPAALSAYAEDVVAVARETGASVLVGNSLGGAVALHVALEHGFEPDALVLCGTGAKLAVHEDVRELLESDFEAAVELLHGPDMLFHENEGPHHEGSMELMRETGQAVTQRDLLTCHVFDVRDRLGDVDVPALATTGEHDRLTPPKYHEYLAEHLPDGRWETIPDAAHLSMVERPRAFEEAVERFLDDR